MFDRFGSLSYNHIKLGCNIYSTKNLKDYYLFIAQFKLMLN